LLSRNFADLVRVLFSWESVCFPIDSIEVFSPKKGALPFDDAKVVLVYRFGTADDKIFIFG